MIITFDRSVFSKYGTPDVDKKTFGRILALANIKGSTISLGPQCDVNNANLDSSDLFFLIDLLKNSSKYPQPKRASDCAIKVNGESFSEGRIIGMSEACEYISFPAIIIVENGTNDGYFLRAIERNFDSSINFEHLLSENIVAIDNGGGSGALSRVEYYLSIHQKKAKLLRCMVIVDGDKRFPGDNDYANKKKQEKESREFSQKGILYHILSKRSLENYMPDEVFNDQKRSFGVSWVNAYVKLSDEQKDYFCTASGFKKDIPNDHENKFENLPKEIQSLFTDIGGNFNILKDCSNLGNFKEAFAELFFNSPYVNKTTLLKRLQHPRASNPDEFNQITEKIRQLL